MTTRNIETIFDQSISLIKESKKNSESINQIIDMILSCYKNNGKVIIFGNGGSAADSQHFAAELVGRFKINRQGIPAISLTTDTSILTAIGNDYSFEDIFSRQCEAIANNGDVVIGISTSGNSKNVIRGLNKAKTLGSKIIGILGNDGGEIASIVDISIIVPSKITARIQEVHKIILHIICEKVEEHLFEKNSN